jgi:hypothetical protein
MSIGRLLHSSSSSMALRPVRQAGDMVTLAARHRARRLFEVLDHVPKSSIRAHRRAFATTRAIVA